MNKTFQKTTRRSFLKKMTGTVAATTIGISGWSNIINPSSNYKSDLKIFSEGKIGSLRLKNRLIRAAALERASLNGYPTDAYLKMHESLAVGGVGLILTGAMAPVPPGMDTQIYVYDDKYIPGLEMIAKIVHSTDNSCKIMAQVVHFGNGFGPSGISWDGSKTLEILNIEQIKTIISSLSESIRRIKDAGFDGAELNAHYAYLLSSFLSPHTNKRTDEYGGSVENRVRIVREIVEQARTKVGNDFPILIKFNCDDSFSPDVSSEDGININNFPLLAAEIEKAGFDAIEISGYTVLRTNINTLEEESYFSKYAENLNIHIPVILTGGNRSIDRMEEILNKGKVDFFGLARPLIREPDLPKRWSEAGSSVKCKCISCNSCFFAEGPLRCMQENG